MTKAMRRLTDAMNRVDDELYTAQHVGNVSAQIVALLERAQLWRRYAQLLEQSGRESAGAVMAAQRDEATAYELAPREDSP